MPWGIINMTIGLLVRFQQNVGTDDEKGKPPVSFLCFLSIRRRDFSGMQITPGDHSVCFVRSYLRAGGLTNSQGE